MRQNQFLIKQQHDITYKQQVDEWNNNIAQLEDDNLAEWKASENERFKNENATWYEKLLSFMGLSGPESFAPYHTTSTQSLPHPIVVIGLLMMIFYIAAKYI